MKARCRISTNGERSTTLPLSPTSQRLWPVPEFRTDSKPLTGIRRPLVRTFLVIGLERAFTKMPANLKVFHPEAPRREL